MHRGELWEEREKEHARRDRAYAKVLRWAKCGMSKGKRAEREGQSDRQEQEQISRHPWTEARSSVLACRPW